jgi:hypothetical protein
MDQPNCLTEDEVAQGYRLLCVSHPLSDVVLDA